MSISKKLITYYVKEKLKYNKQWILRALVRLYQQQTNNEKLLGMSSDTNGIGFSKYDSFILSSLAEQYIKRKFLTQQQLNVVSNKIYKYHKQIIEMSDKNKLINLFINDPINIQTKLEI